MAEENPVRLTVGYAEHMVGILVVQDPTSRARHMVWRHERTTTLCGIPTLGFLDKPKGGLLLEQANSICDACAEGFIVDGRYTEAGR